MANLIKPEKEKHQYVIGIDFGHGETSAAICPLEWDTEAGKQEKNFTDIDIDIRGRKNVITSAICVSDQGVYIGAEAFEHVDNKGGIRLNFKQKPSNIDGEAEKLMTHFMEAVYNRIREIQPQLTDTNHIVYIARPSGWQDEKAKEFYQQMAIRAGIPLGGLTSESRAAIFYAKGIGSFANHITQGAIVFDLGSSTLDLTHISDQDKPIDYGYDLGASIIDRVIFQEMIVKNNETIATFLKKFPVYEDALIFIARKFKEAAYSRNEQSKTIVNSTLESYISEESAAFNDYADELVKLRVENLSELNNLISTKSNYIREIEEALVDFKREHIPERIVNGVFLTGGASRMNFIRPLAASVFDLPLECVQFDPENPSLTVSRGITLLGAADAITNVLLQEIKDSISVSELDIENLYTSFINKLSSTIPNAVWPTIVTAVNDWQANSKETEKSQMEKDLNENYIQRSVNKYAANSMKKIVSDILLDCIISENNEIRRRINDIIRIYASDRELSFISIEDFNSDEVLQENVKIMIDSITSCVDETLKNIGELLLHIVLAILFGYLYLFVRGIIEIIRKFIDKFRTPEQKRKKIAEKILNKKSEIAKEMSKQLNEELSKNEEIKNSIRKTFTSYLSTLLDSNLNQVKIPIE